MSKRTFQPNNRHRAKTHGFRLRMRTRAGRAIVLRPPPQGPLRAVRLRHRACWRPPTGCGRPQTSEAGVRAPGSSRRSGGLLVVYLNDAARESTAPARVGLIVSKAVGGAVVRTGPSAGCGPSWAPGSTGIPGGSDVVVRANPAAGDATSTQLGHELDRLLGQVLLGARR